MNSCVNFFVLIVRPTPVLVVTLIKRDPQIQISRVSFAYQYSSFVSLVLFSPCPISLNFSQCYQNRTGRLNQDKFQFGQGKKPLIKKEKTGGNQL